MITVGRKNHGMNVTIIGGGSTAHALIPFLSGAGHSVSILTRRPKEWASEVAVQHQSIHGEVLIVYSGFLAKASDNPMDVIPNTDVIILCMPVSKYRIALHKIAPYVDNTRKVFIGTIFGQAGFNWMVEEIKRKFDLNNVVYFAVGLVPWICRIIEYGKVGVTYGSKPVNIVAISHQDEFEYLNNMLLSDFCERWFQKGAFRRAENFLSLTLSVDNQIIHPTRCYGLFLRFGGKWSSQEEIPFFYRDYDQLSADLLGQVDDDYTAIREAIKAKYPRKNFEYMLDYLALDRLTNKSTYTDIRESIVKSETLGAIKPPTVQSESGAWVIDTNHRFFTDDIHYGLCIAKWISEMINVDTPSIDSLLGWAQDLRGERIIMGGKLIQDSDSLSQEFMSGIPTVYGYNRIDDIID